MAALLMVLPRSELLMVLPAMDRDQAILIYEYISFFERCSRLTYALERPETYPGRVKVVVRTPSGSWYRGQNGYLLFIKNREAQ
jgi:hypothetical protein